MYKTLELFQEIGAALFYIVYMSLINKKIEKIDDNRVIDELLQDMINEQASKISGEINEQIISKLYELNQEKSS